MSDLQKILAALSDQYAVQPSPLLAYEQRALQYGNRISHLPVDPRLVEAWLRVTSSPFYHPHAVALSSLRRGEHFALFGPTPVADECLHLTALERLSALPECTVLLLAPDAAAAQAHVRSLRNLSRAMEPGPPVALVGPQPDRQIFRARLLVMTPTDLDQRLLQQHRRSFNSFVERLDLVLIAGYQRLSGIAALHLQHMLQRLERLSGRSDLQYGLTAVDVALPNDALQRLASGAWRGVTIDEGPRAAQAVAVWQIHHDRTAELAHIAEALSAAAADVHVVAHAAEVAGLEQRLARLSPAVTVGSELRPARILIFSSPDVGARRLAEAAAGDAELSVICVGQSAAEQIFAQSAQFPREHRRLGQHPAWYSAASNSYVTARHLLCSAAERPLTAVDAEAWQVEDYVGQLLQHGALRPVPADRPAYIPGPDSEPYTQFDLHVPAGLAAQVTAEGASRRPLDPASFDRWYFADAAVPPLRGGLRVAHRDEANLELSVEAAPAERRTLPLRRCRVTVREQRNERGLTPAHRLRISLGRVLVNEETVGHIAGTSADAQRVTAAEPSNLTWLSSAVWIDLPLQRNVVDQQIGWSLAAVLPLLSCAELTDLVPLYDETSQRLYLVDAQPAGSGLCEWLYTEIESLLPTAYQLALLWQQDAVLRETAEADLEWLQAILDYRSTDQRAAVTPRETVSVAVQATIDALASRQQRGTAPTRPDLPPAPARPLRSGDATPSDRRQDTASRRSAILPAGLVPQSLRPVQEPAPSESAPRRITRKAAERREFHVGDRVSCSPYGSGVVRAVTLDGSRRLLLVDFGDFGELPIDPALSPLRLLARTTRNAPRDLQR